jgi:hypothetical protein
MSKAMRPDDILPFLESLPALLQRAMSEVAGGDLARGPAAGGFAPRMMHNHDRSHARELADLLAEIAPRNASLPALRALAGSASPGSGREVS